MKENHWLLPIDPTPQEREIAIMGIESIYTKFHDPIDQLIIAMCFELGYPQKNVAMMTRKSTKTIWLRIKKIKTVLATSHKSYLKSDSIR